MTSRETHTFDSTCGPRVAVRKCVSGEVCLSIGEVMAWIAPDTAALLATTILALDGRKVADLCLEKFGVAP